MGKFIIIGERIHCISPAIREAMDNRDPEPILARAREQLVQGATYLDVNIGPAAKDGEARMEWAVKLLQENFDNVPLSLDTANKAAIEAGIRVYNRAKGKPIINSADAGDRRSYIDLAAAGDAIIIALCSRIGIPADNEERMAYCQDMLEHGMSLGMEPEDMWFDPLCLVIKGMQEKQLETLDFIRQLRDIGLNSVCGISNVSNGMPKETRPVIDATEIAMAIYAGLTAAILNPSNQRMMETVKSADIIMNNVLYADSFLQM
ncbi:MAG: dihydropteroate synthase [Gracilibacteraceae bacterium]|jgi:5-methyltetrahydrofolate corrinoid/iron sulfur protein methyltransferase|nr:dihydropteroate synthase [Gracilibacteraceae bacterium]